MEDLRRTCDMFDKAGIVYNIEEHDGYVYVKINDGVYDVVFKFKDNFLVDVGVAA